MTATDDEVDEGGETVRERVFHADLDRDSDADTVERFGVTVHPVVFPLSIAVIVAFIAATILLGDRAAAAYEAVFAFSNENFGWLYVLAVSTYLVALVAIGLSRYGRIRLGGSDAEPEFSRLAWVAMLFSSGMGVGLLFFGVAEPTSHLLSGGGSFFDATPNTPEAGRAATALTMFHWGLHPWGIYGIVGLGLGFFSYNRGLPLSFRSVFYPVLGERIYGWPGHLVDLAAVIATVFGLAATTGLSALQINAGLDFIASRHLGTGTPSTAWMSVGIIAVIIGITTISAWAGLRAGIRRLSLANVVLMVSLLVVVFVVGPTVYLLDVFASGLGAYLGNIVELSFHAEAFAGDDAGWQHAYTVFYWGFWLVWSPFVGMFIARISKGRTIREFVAGVLLVPTVFSLVWMAAFSGAALFVELNVLSGGISGPLQAEGRAVALFEMLSFYRLTLLTSIIATVNLVTFFVTSVDSGSLVTSYLAAGGKRDTTRLQRAIWPVFIGLTATVLLLGNGLRALKTAVIAAGLPFVVIVLLFVYMLHRGLKREVELQGSGENAAEFAADTADIDGSQSLDSER